MKRRSARKYGTTAFRVLIAGGGTGGHVIPALAIGRELQKNYGAQLLYVGTERGLETRLIPEAGFRLELVHVGQLKNVSMSTRLKTMGDLPRGILRCIELLRSFRPHVVVGVGGYASGPAMAAALMLRVPTMAFEPNAVPGLANRLVGRFVSAAAVNFDETARYFRRAEVTGIPVRPEFFAVQPRTGGPKHLLIMGGSQGARALNEVVPKFATRLLAAVPGLTILHQAGERHAAATLVGYEQAAVDPDRVLVAAFLSDIAHHVADADVVLCRSGASTVAELCAAGRASVLVPFPQAADDHQRKNAEALVAEGAAEMVLEREMTPEKLLDVVEELLRNDARRHAMSAAARDLAHEDALERIADLAVTISSRREIIP